MAEKLRKRSMQKTGEDASTASTSSSHVAAKEPEPMTVQDEMAEKLRKRMLKSSEEASVPVTQLIAKEPDTEVCMRDESLWQHLTWNARPQPRPRQLVRRPRCLDQSQMQRWFVKSIYLSKNQSISLKQPPPPPSSKKAAKVDPPAPAVQPQAETKAEVGA